jgi:hypothetical protein
MEIFYQYTIRQINFETLGLLFSLMSATSFVKIILRKKHAPIRKRASLDVLPVLFKKNVVKLSI